MQWYKKIWTLLNMLGMGELVKYKKISALWEPPSMIFTSKYPNQPQSYILS